MDEQKDREDAPPNPTETETEPAHAEHEGALHVRTGVHAGRNFDPDMAARTSGVQD